MEKKKSNQIKSCDLCKHIFENHFKERPFEFSNWRGVLDFNKKNVKDIMIIALIFGIVGIIVDDSKGLAIAGLIFGILGLLLRFLVSYFFATFLSSLIP